MMFYEVKRIADNLYSIKEDLFGNKFPIVIYLVIGTEKAALIDTGLGSGNLRQVVEAITKLPIIVLHTHGHIDHIGADALFDEVYLNPLEYGLSDDGYAYHLKPSQRIKFFEKMFEDNNDLFDQIQKNMVSDTKTDFIHINDGDVIDLGAVRLTAVATPGHTAGSLSFVNRKDLYAFTGDGIADIHWFDTDSVNVEGFLHMLNHFEKVSAGIKNIYAAHLPNALRAELVHDLQKASSIIVNGSDDSIENSDYQFLIHGDMYVHRTGIATIYYRKENIYSM